VTEHDAAGPEEQGLPDYAAPPEELTGVEPAAVASDTVLPGAMRGDSDIPDTEASDPLWQFPEGVPSADAPLAHGVSPEEGIIGALVDPDGVHNEDRSFAAASSRPRAVDPNSPDDVGDEVGGQGLLGDDLANDGLRENALAASSLVGEELREKDIADARLHGRAVAPEVVNPSPVVEPVLPRGELIGGEPPTAHLENPGLPYNPEDPLTGWRDPEADAAKDAEIEAEIEAELNAPPTPIEVVRDPLISLDTGKNVALPGIFAVAIAAIALAFFLGARGVGNPAEHGVPQETAVVTTPGNVTTVLPTEVVTVTGPPEGRTYLLNPTTGETITVVQPGETVIYDPNTGELTR